MEINFDCEGAEGFTRVSGLTTPEGKRGRGKVEERNREGGGGKKRWRGRGKGYCTFTYSVQTNMYMGEPQSKAYV